MTGLHTISDTVCRGCAQPLGWRYFAAADEEQSYKVGALIFERANVVYVQALGSDDGDGEGSAGDTDVEGGDDGGGGGRGGRLRAATASTPQSPAHAAAAHGAVRAYASQ